MTRITSRRAAAFAFAVLAVPGLAACGSDSDDALAEAKSAASAAAASAESASAVAESALAAVEDVADTAGDVAESALAVAESAADVAESALEAADTAAAEGDDAAASTGGGSNPDSDYCKKVRTTAEAFSGLDDIDPQNFGDLVSALEKAGGEVAEVADIAPDSVKADWKAISDVINEAAEALGPFKDLDLSDPASIDPAKLAELETLGPKLEALGTTIDSSGEKIDEVTKAECGFVLKDLGLD